MPKYPYKSMEALSKKEVFADIREGEFFVKLVDWNLCATPPSSPLKGPTNLI
jgi:hypothetical protein